MSSSPTPRAVFRVSPLMVLFALFLGMCAVPVAFGAPYLWLIYLVPLGIVAWTLRTRTVVDSAGLRVRRLVGGRRVPWDAVGGLRVDRKNTVHAVLTDGGELTLPAVQVRDLPAVAVASGGRIPDPAAAATETDTPPLPATPAASDPGPSSPSPPGPAHRAV